MAVSVTRILEEARTGEPGAQERLLDAVYGELRTLADARMGRERPGHTLQPTALVHETWLRIAGSRASPWQDRAHFLATAARIMRSILVDAARARLAQKRGGGRAAVTWHEDRLGEWGPAADELLAVHEALERLEELDARRSRVVELRFFAGMSMAETAAVMDVSERTVYGLWEHARAWLYRELQR